MIALQTLTDHPVGSSGLSNAIELSGRDFQPFVLFCYFDVHKRHERYAISLEPLAVCLEFFFSKPVILLSRYMLPTWKMKYWS